MKYDIERRLIAFSVKIIQVSGKMNENFAKEHLSRQVIRSATSAALNYGEAQSSASTKDFIHKMGICLKELRETLINLRIQNESGLIQDSEDLNILFDENKQLIAIFATSIRTAKENSIKK